MRFDFLRVLSLVALLAGAWTLDASPVFHVDSDRGDDGNPGSEERPFATIARARDAVRALASRDDAAVELNGRFESSGETLLELGAADGASTSAHPVVWRAGRRGALLTGSMRLDATMFRPVTGPDRARLRPEARDLVRVCELSRCGIGELPPLPAKFTAWTAEEVFDGGRPMTIARYPNRGFLVITNVIDRGVKPVDESQDEWEFGCRGGAFTCDDPAFERWNAADGVYLFGYWRYDWYSDSLRVAKIDRERKAVAMEGVHAYGIGRARDDNRPQDRRYYAYNLLEELDCPGEYYLDRRTRRLFVFPGPNGFGKLEITRSKRPLAKVEKAANIVISGLTLARSSGLAVSVSDSQSVRLDGLDVSALTTDAINVSGGRDCVVENCRVADIGDTGVRVRGGDRRRLEKCGHVIRNNDIGYCGRLARNGCGCIRFDGCGVTVANNFLHDVPYVAMLYGGNEHLVECNEIACAMLEGGDGGGIYTGRDWGSRGNVVRWNYLHHFGLKGYEWCCEQRRRCECVPLENTRQIEGIYLDDCDSGETVCGNLFYQAGRAMFTGGGRDNRWTHNLVIDCRNAAYFDDRGIQRAKPGSGLKNGWDLLARIERCDYTNEPWASRYPELLGIMDKEPLLPIGTEYVSNVAVRCGSFFYAFGTARTFLQERAENLANVSYDSLDQERELREYPPTNALLRAKLEVRHDDDFTARSLADPRSFQDSPEFRRAFPDFPRIPVERIGLRR